MRAFVSLLLVLGLMIPLSACPGDDDDDDATANDDDATGDDDDSTGDDDDVTGDDDDSTGDDDDSGGDDDDSAGDDDDSTDPPVDADGDGSPEGVDCDDADAANTPGNAEVCDGQDNDCDATTVFAGEDTDADSDGALTCADCDDANGGNYPGNAEFCDEADNDCDPTTSYAGETVDIDNDGVVGCQDCDDADANNFPGNAEVCDGADNDCGATTFATGEDTDADGDGMVTCLDCDDADPANFGGNPEVCDGADNDCNPTTWALDEDTDADSDGSVDCLDCDDTTAEVFPGNPEVCDGQDNDCDVTTVFAGEDTDADGDGASSCADCDDADPANFDGNAEACDGQDNDCDTATEAIGGEIDGDSDGVLGCADCDDADGANFPGNVEVCDGADNDCAVDTVFGGLAGDWVMTDSATGSVPFAPLPHAASTNLALGDDELSGALPIGFDFAFAGALRTEAFVRSNGFVGFDGAEHATVYAPRPLGVDDDLNEFIAVWWADLNPTIAGTIEYETVGTAPDRRFVVTWTDVSYYNLADPVTATTERVTAQLQLHETTHAIEIHVTSADPVAAGLDGVTVGVEGAPPVAQIVYAVDDQATLSNSALRFTANEEADQDGDGALLCGTDCDDTDGDNFAGNPEACDGADNDCNGLADLDAAGEVDGDGDGSLSCDDCDDSAADNAPGGAEVCDGGDNDCDTSTVFAGEDVDGDADGAVSCADCDDADPANFPGNAEVCDGQDNDCDGVLLASDTVQPTPGGSTSTSAERFRGNRYTATATAQLTSLQMWLDGTAGDAVTFMVFEGASGAALSDFTLVASTTATLASSTADWAGAGSITASLVAGNDYVIGAHWTASTQYFWAASPGFPVPVGPLDLTGGIFASSQPAPPVGGDLGANANEYPVAVSVAGEEDADSDGSVACIDCDDSDGANYPGNPEICDGLDNDCAGGADFGAGGDWTITDSVGGAVAFGPISLSAPTPLTLGDDETSSALPIGFDFDFAGSTRTAAYVRSNGWVDFAGQAPTTSYAAYALGADDLLNEVIAFWWADLDPSTGGAITYGTQGSAPDRVFVVDFDSVPYYNDVIAGQPTAELVTVQLQLWETSNLIEVHVTQADAQPAAISTPTWSKPSVGVETTPPNADVYISMDQAATLTATAIRWTPSDEVDSDGDGLSFCAGDCADQDGLIQPGGTEACDGLDSDCDGTTVFAGEDVDADGDNDVSCSDCDDANADISAAGIEICDGLDNDCANGADFDAAGEVDGDGDGALSCVDCDDSDPANYFGNAEACDGGDNDCNGSADFDAAGEVDGDGDSDLSCADCDDVDPAAFTGNAEQCTDTDSDCDGAVDNYLAGSATSAPGLSIGPNANTTTTDTIAVGFTGLVDDLNVQFDITHTFVGDLDITITSPSGTSVQLLAPDFNFGSDDMTDSVFDDEAAGPLSAGAAPFTGSWVPAAALSGFDGEPAAGNWILTIVDVFNQDAGTLNAWSLDFFPEGYGDDAACGALACDELLVLDPAAADGLYTLDPTGTGTGVLTACDMTTNGGGYTLVYGWDRENDGDGIAEWEASWTTSFSHSMGLYQTTTSSLQYQDLDATADTMDGQTPVTVPNSGDVLYDLHFEGTSMERSGVFFGVDLASGVPGELWCNDDTPGGAYSAAELAGVPYACSQTYVGSPTFDTPGTAVSLGAEVTGVFVYAMMYDINGGDDAQLFRYAVWVR